MKRFIPNSALGLLLAPLLCLSARATDHFVSPSGANNPPFLSWPDAATNIQDAIDASVAGDTVWVTNGVYASGGKVMAGDLTNRVTLDKALTVQSINGPFVTTVLGAGGVPGPSAVRCAWLTNNAVLRGFTLQAGSTRTSGGSQLQDAGGAWCSSLSVVVENCVIRSNASYGVPSGAYQGTLNHCLVVGNEIAGTMNCNLKNCTVVSNYVAGIQGGLATNCISYYNGSSGNYPQATLAYCCTTPLPAGSGNFTSAPQLLPDLYHLANSSPWVAAGTNLTTGTDIAGNNWANPPSVGCSQWLPSPVIYSGPTLLITNSPFGFSISVGVTGSNSLTCFWTRDGTPLENDGHYNWAHTTNLVAGALLPLDVGGYQVVVSNAFGMATSAVVTLDFTYHCVDAAGVNPIPPYSSWATAATNIQDAINVAAPGDYVVVTNGVYATGGMVVAGDLTNRIAITNAITVESVNGPGVTIIQGGNGTTSLLLGNSAVRCAWLTNGATLAGFQLQYGGTRTNGDQIALQSGGGVWASSLNAYVINCVLTNNFANYAGGGSYQGSLKQCVLFQNHSVSGGGAYQASLEGCFANDNYASTGSGAYGGSLNNCTMVADFSGVDGSTVRNCIFYGDSYTGSGANVSYSCFYPTGPPNGGTGNINVYPQFIDGVHIAATSPCRGTGNAAYASGADIDGEPWGNPPSMGCDEVVNANLVGPLMPYITPSWTNAAIGKPFTVFSSITGHASRIAWDFGDGSVSNTASFYNPSHIWTNLGNYTVTLTAYNNDYPGGVSTNVVVPVVPIAQPSFLSIVPPQFGSVGMYIMSQPGVSYTLQITTNLTPPISWQNGPFAFTGIGGRFQIVDFSASGSNRFYRVWAH